MASSTYYTDLFAKLDIGRVAESLIGDRITDRTSTQLFISCPRHESISGRSLHIDLAAQQWYCFGCAAGGDVLHLVEFIQSGTVTRRLPSGTAMPPSHRAARDWLSDFVGIPRLSARGAADAEVGAAESEYAEAARIRAVLGALAAHWHAVLTDGKHDEAIKLLLDTWGLTRETIDRYKIGYAEPVGQIAALRAAGFNETDIIASGAFGIDHQDRALPFFRHRIMFPYHERGAVVYFIGRRTRWTENNQYEKAKYKKLPTWSAARKYVSKTIRNDHIFNSDCAAAQRRPDGLVIITEGVTDALALMQAGIPVISPVTTKFRDDDIPRIKSLLTGVPAVFIAQDNEISGAGMAGAMSTASALTAAGINVRIAEIPLLDAHRSARERFAAMPPTEQKADAGRALAERAKRDLCDFLRDAGTAESPDAAASAFRELLPTAKSPIAWAIDSIMLPNGDDPAARENVMTALQPVMDLIAETDALAQAEHAAHIKNRFAIPKTAIMDEIKKRARKHARGRGRIRGTGSISGFMNADGEPVTLAEVAEHYIRDSETIIYADTRWWIYENGYYHDFTEHEEGKLCKFLDDNYRDGNATRNNRGEIESRLKFMATLKRGRKLNDQKHILNLKNGIYDIRKNELLPHDDSHYSTIRLPYDYDPGAPCPRWLRFLDEIFPGDNKSQQLLAEWFGYCLVPDTKFQKVLFCVGDGANGKTIALTMLQHLVGEENCSHIPLSDIGKEFHTIGLKDKLVNLCGEVEAGEISDSAGFKAVSSGDTIEDSFKHRDMVRFRAFARLCFATNNFPQFRDSSFGLYRRMLLLQFQQRFIGDRADLELESKLVAELPGIFQWALCGYRNLMQQNEFTAPKYMENIITTLQESGSLVAQFIDERCTIEESGSEYKSEIRREFTDWCHDQGINRVPSTQRFWIEFKRFANIDTTGKSVRREKKRDRIISGISLLRNDMFQNDNDDDDGDNNDNKNNDNEGAFD